MLGHLGFRSLEVWGLRDSRAWGLGIEGLGLRDSGFTLWIS